MMIDLLYNGLFSIVSMLLGSWGGWFFARRKYNTEVDSNKIDNLAKIIEVQETEIENLNARLNTALERNQILEQEIIALRGQVTELTMKLIDKHVIKDKKPNK